MSQKPRKPWGMANKVTLASVGCLVASATLLIVLRYQTYFQPLLLIALLLLMPAAINFCLLIPRGSFGKTEQSDAQALENNTDVDKDKPQKGFGATLKNGAARTVRAGVRLVARKRTPLLAALIVIAVAVINVFFWSAARGTFYANRLSYFLLVLIAAVFVVFIVLGKWCKHRAREIAEESEDGEAARYGVALLRNMQSAFALGRLALLLTAVTVLLKLLASYDASGWLTIALSLLFAYKTVFMMISLFVVLVRHELDVAPEITAPAPGVEGGSLGVLTYLEKNTGISMRSLWSMQMIKQALPFAALGAVLLLWGASSVVLVNSNQEAAHYRLGRLQEETLDPGLHFTLPWPFDKVEVYDTKTVSQMTVGYVSEGNADNFWTEAHGSDEYRLLLGGGNELVSINLRVMYRISDLRAYLTTSAAPEFLMSAASYEIVTARTITSDLDTMLSGDRAVFAETFREELSAYMVRYNTGLEVVSVVLESIHPPVEIADVYQELISAEIEAERILIDAQAYKGERIAWAWVDYDSKVALANIERYDAIGAAKGSVAEFLASVEADKAYPDDYRYYKYMQAISQAYSGAKIVIVGNGVNEENIYIGSIASGAKE
jgi:regulator of protease activity HflC (stomatin/prohibitin superfamily)